jgi:hypothetical protein
MMDTVAILLLLSTEPQFKSALHPFQRLRSYSYLLSATSNVVVLADEWFIAIHTYHCMLLM